MTNTSTVSRFNDYTVIVSARLGEDLINKIIELSKDGYTVVQGTTRLNTLAPQVCMEKLSEKPVEAPVEDKQEEVVAQVIVEEKAPEKPSEDVTEDSPKTIDDQYIRSLNKDKDKLEEYGRTFGAELDKRKSFVNMVKELRAFVKG